MDNARSGVKVQGCMNDAITILTLINFQYNSDDSYYLFYRSLIFESFKKSLRGAEEWQQLKEYAGNRREYANNESGIQAMFI